MEIELKENERIDDLQFKGLKIVQNEKWFCFGMDSILLSDFAKSIKKDSKVLDLGSGTGIISVLLTAKTKLKEIHCIEKQKEVANMSEKTVKLNKLENKIKVINEDINNLEKIYDNNTFDVIVTNPPYKEASTGMKNENEKKYISKFETTADLSVFIKISAKLLKDKGKLYIVHRPDRLTDILELMRKNKIEPKRLKIVYSYITSDTAKLILVEGVKNGGKFLKMEKNIFVYKENGEYTDEIKKIYNIE